jgi:hypothetical protein
MSIYTDNGYESRAEYLACMSDEYGINIDKVEMVADLLGPSEDFDGLVTTLQDMQDREDWI